MCLKHEQIIRIPQNLPLKCGMRRETHLLKHKRKLHPFFRHAFHIQKTVEFEIQFPLAFVLSFLTASKPDAKHKAIAYPQHISYQKLHFNLTVKSYYYYISN